MRITTRLFRLCACIRLLMLPAVLLGMLASPRAAFAAADCFVDVDAAGNEDGSSWTDAYVDLQDALAEAACGEIWVAAGVYKPGTLDTDTFTVPAGVKIYGGFAGTESATSQRLPRANLTILSGDIDSATNPDTNIDGNFIAESFLDVQGTNSRHVITMDGTSTPITAATLLDGLTITAGFVPGGSNSFDYSGGGMRCNGSGATGQCGPTINNVTFSGNYALQGGALYNGGGSAGISSPTLANVTFRGNRAVAGGAMFNDGIGGTSSPSLTNVTFISNHGTGNANGSAGGMYNIGEGGTSSPVLTNVTFSLNTANNNGGGAMRNTTGTGGTSAPVLTNVIMWGDTATAGGDEIQNDTATPVISYSVVQGSGGSSSWDTTLGTDGGGNLDVDPVLGTLQENGGFTQTMPLMAGSSGIDAGSGCALTDQRGVSRPRGAGCDIGAYEKIPYVPSDFDDDATTDPVKFDSASSAWWRRSTDSAWDGVYLGAGTYVRRSDFDGDGRADPAKFDASSLWYVKSSNGAFTGQYMGPGTYTFVAGSDYEGDGKTDPAQFNTTVNALWYYGSNDSAWHGIYLGPGTYSYVTGSDFDGDGMSDPAHFNYTSNVLWYMQSSDMAWYGEYLGPGTYTYVEASDFDGDGMTDPAQFTSSSNTLWYIPSGGGGLTGVWMGGTPLTYVPAADFDGDGMTDPAGFDAAAHTIWYIESSTASWKTFDMGAGTYTIVN